MKMKHLAGFSSKFIPLFSLAFIAAWLMPLSLQAQLFYTNTSGLWSTGGWTNQAGSAVALANFSNIVFNTAGTNGNNMAAGGSYGSVTWLADVTNRQITAASRYYFTGFTNKGNNTVVWNVRTTFSNGTPVVYNEGTLTMANSITNLTGSAITFDSAASALTTVSGVIGSNNMGVVKNGAGKLTLSGANTYAGSTTLNAGTLAVTSINSLGAGGQLIVNGGTISNTATFQLTNNINLAANLNVRLIDASQKFTLAGSITNAGGLVVSSADSRAKLALSGANTFSGGVNLTGAQLHINGANALGTGVLTINSGSLDNTAGVTITNANNNVMNWAGDFAYLGSGSLHLGNGTVNLGAGTRTVLVSNQVLTVGGAITNSGALAVGGTGAMVLSGANTYSGGTTVSGGTLDFANTAAKPASGSVTVGAGAALALGVGGGGYFSAADVDSLWANTLSGVTMDANALVGIDTSAGDLNYSTSHSDRGLVKLGANTLTLSGANTFSNGITIYNGTLKMGVASAIADNNAVTVNGGAWDMNGYAKTVSSLSGLGGSITNNGGLTVTQTNSTTLSSAIVGSSGVTMIGSGNLWLQGANSYDGQTLIGAGSTISAVGSQALGSVVGNTVVSNSGILRFQTSDFTNSENFTISGKGSNGGANDGALVMQINSGITKFDGKITISGGAKIASFWSGNGSCTISQGIDGTGDLLLAATSANNGNTTFFLNGQSTYTGDTYLQNFNMGDHWGLFQLGINNALPTTSILYLQAQSANNNTNYLKFALNGFDQQLAGLSSTTSTRNYMTNIVVGGSATLSTLTVSNMVDTFYDGNLGGAGANENNLKLIKTGSGTLVLASRNGGNTYTGGTLINNGALSITNTGALPSWNVGGGFSVASNAALAVGNAVAESDIATILGTGNFAAGSFLGFDTATARTNANAITDVAAGALGLMKIGTSTLVVTNNNSFSGAVVVKAGTLQMFNSTKSSTNVYSGGTFINGGTLYVNSVSNLGAAAAITLDGGTLRYTNAITLGTDRPITLNAGGGTINGEKQTMTINSTISGVGGLTKRGDSNLILNGTNTYLGITDGGNSGSSLLDLRNPWAASTNEIRMGSFAELAFGGSGAFTLSNKITLAKETYLDTGAVAGLHTVQGGISIWATNSFIGSGASSDPANILFVNGVIDAGTNASARLYILNGIDTAKTVLGGQNTYGDTVISRGILQLTNGDDRLPVATTLVLGGYGRYSSIGGNNTNAIFDLNGYNQRVAGLAEDGTTLFRVVTNSAVTLATLTVSNDVANLFGTTVSNDYSRIAGNVALKKQGVGTLTLTGANTYTGGTAIEAGTLVVGDHGSLGLGPISVGMNATLFMAGRPLTLASGQSFTNRGFFGGGLVIGAGALATGPGQYQNVTNAAGGTLTPGVGGDTNYFADLTLMGGSTNTFWLGSAATHDMSTVTNSLSYGGVNGTDAPLLKLDLSSWANGANVGQTVVLYDNYAPVTAWNGTNQLFRLSDVGGLFDGMLLTNGMVFAISGSGTGQFKINYDLEGAGGSGNDIMLTVIPEPASINLLAMLGAAYFMRRRIHRKKSRWNF